jgi:hypothetical protein
LQKEFLSGCCLILEKLRGKPGKKDGVRALVSLLAEGNENKSISISQIIEKLLVNNLKHKAKQEETTRPPSNDSENNQNFSSAEVPVLRSSPTLDAQPRESQGSLIVDLK